MIRPSEMRTHQNNGITEITDYNDKQPSVDNKQDIPPTSNPQEKQNNGITNITDLNDAEASDKRGTAGSSIKNIENNSNNIDIISNSYNNRSNNLATVTPHFSTNIPSSSSGCVTSVIPLPDNSLDGLPTLSCLFCSTYKTKIRFDMDLHLYEKHKQNLICDLPIPVKKATIDDTIEYALQLIEQGKIIVPKDPNEDRWSADGGCE
jgi:hypothetical protein